MEKRSFKVEHTLPIELMCKEEHVDIPEKFLPTFRKLLAFISGCEIVFGSNHSLNESLVLLSAIIIISIVTVLRLFIFNYQMQVTKIS